MKVLRGSPIYDRREEFGIVYSPHPPYEVLYTKWLSYGDVIRLKGIEEMVEVYYNSGQFPASVAGLARCFQRPFRFYERLAQYYDKNGLSGISHSRIRRYEILRDFACQETDMAEDVLSQLLTYDCYLRENVKNRPSFLSFPGSVERGQKGVEPKGGQGTRNLVRLRGCDQQTVDEFGSCGGF